MRTPQEIADAAAVRFNKLTNSAGMLTRQDIVDFLAQLDPEADKIEALKEWLDTISFLPALDKSRILNDLPSYGL
jgi:hypothetical protein